MRLKYKAVVVGLGRIGLGYDLLDRGKILTRDTATFATFSDGSMPRCAYHF